MSSIGCYSAWGFETANKNLAGYIEYVKKNTFTGRLGDTAAINKLALKELKFMNVQKVIGYIPIVGILAGIVRIVVFCTTRNDVSSRTQNIV